MAPLEMGGAQERLAGPIPHTPGVMIPLGHPRRGTRLEAIDLTALARQVLHNRQVADAIDRLLCVSETDTATFLEAADRLVDLTRGGHAAGAS